jgi:Uncharacterized conserved protein
LRRSGLYNSKQRELLELQQLAQQRLARARGRLAEGYQDAKEVTRDLEYTQKRVSYVFPFLLISATFIMSLPRSSKYPFQYHRFVEISRLIFLLDRSKPKPPENTPKNTSKHVRATHHPNTRQKSATKKAIFPNFLIRHSIVVAASFTPHHSFFLSLATRLWTRIFSLLLYERRIFGRRYDL